MTCYECGERIDGEAHFRHEPACPDEDWCRCETRPVHAGCCPDCPPVVLPGQLTLGGVA